MSRKVLGVSFKNGDVIGGAYRVAKKLGEGGCGSVYRCQDADGDVVAIKLLHNINDLPRFTREVKVTSTVSSRKGGSDHIVAAYTHDIHAQQWPYVVLEYCDGGSLADLLEKRGKFSPAEAAWMLIMAIRGLKVAKIAHRDIKPENLLIQKGSAHRGYEIIPGDCDRGLRVKVSDFGLAKSTDKQTVKLTQSGTIMGTPAYMSPEQSYNTKQTSFKTDIYALGVVFYELVKGKLPFDANNVHDLISQHRDEIPSFKGLPENVSAICQRCMEKKTKDRYPSLASLEKDLDKVIRSSPATVKTRANTKATAKNQPQIHNDVSMEPAHSGHNRSKWIMFLAILIIAGSLAVWYWHTEISELLQYAFDF